MCGLNGLCDSPECTWSEAWKEKCYAAHLTRRVETVKGMASLADRRAALAAMPDTLKAKVEARLKAEWRK